MRDYKELLDAIAAGEPVETGEVYRALGDAGITIKQALLDMREAVQRLDWCQECGARGIIRTSRTDGAGDLVVTIICRQCRKELSKQKRRNPDFCVPIHKLREKYLGERQVEN